MKTMPKRILITSAALAGAGLILMGIGIGMGGLPGVVFSKNGISSPYRRTDPYIQKKTTVDAFSNLDLNIKSDADIRILPSDDDKYYVEYLLDGDAAEPVCKVEDHTLMLSQTDSDIHDIGMFGISLGDFDSDTPYISVYIPKDVTLKETDIYNDYGNISISDNNMENAFIQSNYGAVSFDNVSVGDLNCTLEYGDLTFDAASLETLNCKSEYGSVSLFLPVSIRKYQTDIRLSYGALELPKDALLEHYADGDGEISYQAEADDETSGKKLSLQSMNGSVTIRYR